MKRRILSIIAILFLVSISIPALAGTVEYTYDELNRIKTVIYEDGTTIVYDYDDVGNRTIRQVYSDTPPSAEFVADNTNVEVGQTVNFTDQSAGDITTWSWDFDNNGTEDSAEQNPSYIYNTAATYTVSLTVTGPGGSDTETKLDYIQVTEPPPVYVISGLITESGVGLDGVTVDLSGSITDSTVTAGGGYYSFSVPDGSYTITPSLTDYEFTPPSSQVTVSGADVPNQDFTASGVTNQPPVADAGQDVNAIVLEYITFDGTGSNDPDGNITDYYLN